MKILITGGTGMVGSAFKNIETEHELVLIGSRDYKLNRADRAYWMLQNIKPDAIIHLAAQVGGIKANMDYAGDFYINNIRINTNVLDAAKNFEVGEGNFFIEYMHISGQCNLSIDRRPNSQWTIPHSSNYAYAYAKRMLDVQSRAYRKQYGCNFITAIPNNLFGENDNFDLENSHVVPAMIRKMYEAKLNDEDVTLWGDGSPLREFTYSKDLAEILLFLLEHYDEEGPINVGNTNEISIKAVAEMIAGILDFKGQIVWDITKPKGQFRKPSDNSKLLELGWREENYTNFKKALTNVCQDVILRYPHLRGVK